MLFRAPEYRKVAAAGADAGRARAVDRDLRRRSQEGLRGAQGALRDAGAAPASSRSCSRTWRRPRPPPRSIAKGTTFAALAAERGLKDTDIDLGTVAKTAMVDRAVADAAFALKEGEVSAPVEGRFGIALVQVVKIEPAQTEPFEEVAAELKQELATERARAEVAQRARQDRGRAARRRDARRIAQEAQSQDPHHRGDRPLRPRSRRQAGRRPAARRRRAVARRSPPTSAPRTIRCSCRERRLRLVRGRRTSRRRATARSTRSRTRSRRAGATTRSRTRLKAKADEMLEKLKAGTPFAEVAAADKLKAGMAAGLKRGNPPPGIPARALEDLPHPEGRRRQRRRRDADRAHRVPRHRDHGAAARSASRPTPSASTRRCAARSSDDLLAQYVARLESESA